MATTTEILRGQNEHVSFESGLQEALGRIRHIDINGLGFNQAVNNDATPGLLSRYSNGLRDGGKTAEADALDRVREKVIDKKAFGGLGLGDNTTADPAQQTEILFLVEAWLEAINSQERARDFLCYRKSPTEGTRPMTLAQKIFAQHAVGEKPAIGLAAGDVVRVGIDWILASELSWQVRTMIALWCVC